MSLILTLKRNINVLATKAYKHRGDICFFSGAGLTMVGTGLFVRATSRLKDYAREVEEEENRKKLVTKKAVKEFALPVGVSAVGYGMELYSHQTMKSDLTKASLALNSVTLAYESLKQRIEEKEGPDKAAELIDNVKVNDEGKVEYGENEDLFTAIFYEPNPHYNEAKGCNKAFLLMQQDSEDFSLSQRGKLFLDKVLDDLGFEQEADIVREQMPNAGWVYKMKDGSLNHVSFGLDRQDAATRRFMEECEPSVLLRFNCVPNVYDYI